MGGGEGSNRFHYVQCCCVGSYGGGDSDGVGLHACAPVWVYASGADPCGRFLGSKEGRKEGGMCKSILVMRRMIRVGRFLGSMILGSMKGLEGTNYPLVRDSVYYQYRFTRTWARRDRNPLVRESVYSKWASNRPFAAAAPLWDPLTTRLRKSADARAIASWAAWLRINRFIIRINSFFLGRKWV